MKDFCVCILAHNEQKHICQTIRAIVNAGGELDYDIVVYANGCTDGTAEVVKALVPHIPNLSVRELSLASKPHAWNTAFSEQKNSILVFSDGDVQPEIGAVKALWRFLSIERTEAVLAGCTLWPQKEGLTISQRVCGFLQIPLKQDFLAGGLYACRRNKLEEELRKKNLTGIPSGIVGEDLFLQLLIPPEKFFVIRNKVFYEPPALVDYWRYLARVRWQEEQLCVGFGIFFADRLLDEGGNLYSRIWGKFVASESLWRLFLGIISTMCRIVVKTIFRKKIYRHYRVLGTVSREGGEILSRATRSQSAK